MATIPKEIVESEEQSARIRRVNGRPVLVGQLPEDFLRLPGESPEVHNGLPNGSSSPPGNGPPSQVQSDLQLAMQLQNELNYSANYERRVRAYSEQYSAQVMLTAVDARLAKNYGIMNMSTYIRFRIGHIILETQTATRGGKEPRWNQQIRCNLPRGIDTIWAEIFQECMLTTDEKIAEGKFQLPEDALQFSENEREKTIEASIPLSGRQGTEKEGTLQLVLTLRDIHSPNPNFTGIPRDPPLYYPQPNSRYRPFYPYTSVQPGVQAYAMPSHHGNPYGQPAYMAQDISQVTPIVPRAPVIRDEDIAALKEMFPKIDAEIIRTELVNNGGNVDATTTALLELNSTT